MSEISVDKKALLSQILKSPHGKLVEYLPVCLKAAAQDPDFFAHLVAYNHVKGQVRDAKVALPIIALLAERAVANGTMLPYAENALAHLADLRPREFYRALEFAKDIKAPIRLLRRLTERYLRDLETDRAAWNRAALQHRRTLHRLYAKWALGAPGGAKTKADWPWEKAVLFGTAPDGSVFQKLRDLHLLTPDEIAGTIQRYQIPFVVLPGALGEKMKDPDVVLAMMKRMTSTELVTNMKWLESVGVKTVPALRAQLEESLGKAGKDRKAKATLKTTKAAEALVDDEVLSGKLHVLQEKQVEKVASIEGDWLVLADKSGSMEVAMEIAKQIASVLARLVKGRVHLVFFDTAPRYFDATGKTLEELQALTKALTAVGGTSIGVGLAYCLDRGFAVDGIAIVSDGCENNLPQFSTEYQRYARKFESTPTVYLYQTATFLMQAAIDRYGKAAVEREAQSQLSQFLASVRMAGIDMQTFDLTGGTDYYAIPNLVATCRVQRYSLLDEIHGVPLRTLDEVLDRTVGMKVLANECKASTLSLTR